MEKHSKGYRVTAKDVEKMHELQTKGLSHSQIAIEMGFARNTIGRYLGMQKKGSRTPYGALKTYSDGESFVGLPVRDEMPGFMPLSKRVAMEEAGVYIPKEQKESVLTVTSEEWTKRLKGSKYSYTLICDGKDILCAIRETLTGDEMNINAEDLNDLIKELLALKAYLPQK